MEDYLKAKKDLKRDFIIFLSISIAMIVIVAVLLGVFVLFEKNNLESYKSMTSGEQLIIIVFEVVGSLCGGVLLASMLPGWILSFRFVWRKLGGLSILLAMIVYAIGAAYGWLITLIYFIVGFNKVRKLGKALGVQK